MELSKEERRVLNECRPRLSGTGGVPVPPGPQKPREPRCRVSRPAVACRVLTQICDRTAQRAFASNSTSHRMTSL
jgi:hypothetical protein